MFHKTNHSKQTRFQAAMFENNTPVGGRHLQLQIWSVPVDNTDLQRVL